MKKFIYIFLVFITCFTLFAEKVPVIKYDSLDFTFQPTMARYDAMGQSGLATPTKLDSFYTNPANLAIKRGFGIAVPSVSVPESGKFTVITCQQLKLKFTCRSCSYNADSNQYQNDVQAYLQHSAASAAFRQGGLFYFRSLVLSEIRRCTYSCLDALNHAGIRDLHVLGEQRGLQQFADAGFDVGHYIHALVFRKTDFYIMKVIAQILVCVIIDVEHQTVQIDGSCLFHYRVI